MDIQIAHDAHSRPGRNLLGAIALAVAASTVSCSNPGYRTAVYPGQQGQYSLQRVPEPAQPAPAAAPAEQAPASQAPAPAPISAAPTPPPTPVDENLSQVEAIWPKLSDSDKALLAETAKHLAAQR